MPTITVMDPVTRIEGHLKIEVTIDSVAGRQQVTDARATGTLFRGFEKILVGRAPTDAPILTARICGVCPVSHGLAATLALEKAAGKQQPTNARLLRNLVLGANYVQSHILHFYLLSAIDYVPGPGKAPWAPAWDVDMRSDPRLGGIVPHLVASIEARRRAHEMGAVFGGRMPSPHTFVPGGFTSTVTAARVSAFRGHLTWLRDFIRTTYLPDAEAIAAVYDDYFAIGAGFGNLLAFGVFEQANDGSSWLLKRGTASWATGGTTRPAAIRAFDVNGITEHVRNSWYADASTQLKPANGRTDPVYPKGNAYSWLKAPRYAGRPYEAGPLARMWVNGDYRRGVSVMDRHLARARECLKVADAMDGWLGQLQVGGAVFGGFDTPQSGSGVGMTEAPRGALAHWVRIDSERIAHYQVVTPTCWNASPRDDKGVLGPMEKALVGTPIADAERPLEALRVVHSFDPCLSCAVHVMRPDGRPVAVLRSGPPA
jgi:hydrogenase large subunit